MSHNTTNRPRMASTYAPGTVRARRWHGDGDVRGYRPPRGWIARADLTDLHPITGRALPRAVWWIIETKEYQQCTVFISNLLLNDKEYTQIKSDGRISVR